MTRKKVVLIIAAAALLVVAVFYLTVFRSMLLKMKYRMAHESSIAEYAEEYSLDPYFISAVIYCESSFRSDAVSRVGATGLMQLMPQTAEEIARKLQMDDFDQSMLTDPDINIRFGCFYLREQMDRFDQNPNLVLSAYNAGPNKTKEWIDKYGLDASGSLTYIPYGETDRYVDRVNSAKRVYMILYPDVFTEEVSADA